jgi:acyl carrier protein
MASNPLPPEKRKPGTVGKAAGPEISVLDIDGNPVASGVRGEVAIRGPNVTVGYVRNPAANDAAFVDGWLKTGDEGMFDADGYLTILGRLKEIINRGGEKISPLEVDDVLTSHPVVAQAVTFAASDDVLGEEVAAAVVLRPGTELTERQLREFVATQLTHFKVPRRILFMDKIPTGPTGKVQRIGLADRLGIKFTTREVTRAPHVTPRTPVEEILASIWAEILVSGAPGVDDNFFDAGGDSTLALQFISQVRDKLAVEVSLIAFFDSPTIAELASAVEEAMTSEASSA